MFDFFYCTGSEFLDVNSQYILRITTDYIIIMIMITVMIIIVVDDE